MAHQAHEDHGDHVHGPGCGHQSVQHEGHVDYLHDGHRHREHDDHWDECEVEEEVEELAADEAQVRRVASGQV